MKTNLQLSVIGLAIVLFLPSCTMEKRVYRTGYHVEWFNSQPNPNKKILTTKNNIKKSQKNTVSSKETKAENPNNENTFAQIKADNKTTFQVENYSSIIANNTSFQKGKFQYRNKSNTIQIRSTENCDVLIFKNGDELRVKVLEIGIKEIKYKDCSNLDGPIFSMNKSEVFMIKYPNGTNTVFSSNEPNQSYKNSNLKATDANQSQTVAFILCFIVGVLGIHRFYLGHIGIGIIQLLTFGGCGIWALVDLIMIATGDLQPKNGEYSERW